MKKARCKGLCEKVGKGTGYFNGKKTLTGSLKKRSKCLYLIKNHFRVIWKSEDASLLKAREEMKKNFELEAVCRNYDFVVAYGRYLKVRTETEVQLNNVKFYDLELFNTAGAIPYRISFYLL